MSDLYFATALLPNGWARNVRIAVDAGGSITDVRVGVARGDARLFEGVAVPGVPNLHSHAFQRGMAGLAERGGVSGDTFWSWRARMYAFLQGLGPEQVEAIAAQLFTELLRHGYTWVAEFHYLRNDPEGGPYADPVEMGRRLLAAASTAGIGMTLLPTVYMASGFDGEPLAPEQRRFAAGVDAVLADVDVLGRAAADLPGASVGLSLHSLRAVPPEPLLAAVDAARSADPDTVVHIHVAEQEREVEQCLAWAGQRPVEWLLDHAPVDARWCLVHATHTTPSETAALARSGAVAGLCPTTEANLGDGLFPFAEFVAARGRWGVGTDSHVSVSPVADLRLLEYGQRLRKRARNVAAGDTGRSTGRALLEGAWSGGAQACGRPLGRLEPGARADVVVLDAEHPSLVGRDGDAVLDSWVFSGEDTPVRDVIVGGRWVVQDGRHVRQGEVADAYRRTVRGLVYGSA